MAVTDSYTEDDAALIAHQKKRTLASWRRRGYGPPWGLYGRIVLYPIAEFDAWFQAQIRRPGQRDQPSAQSEASVQ